jgi:hypothetical protein
MLWNEEKINTVKELIINGKNYVEIAKIIGTTRDSVRYIANKHNLKFENFNSRCPVECDIDEKYCGTCGEKKNKRDFNKNRSRSDGLNSICRKCSNKKSKEYYLENTDKHKKVIIERNKKNIKKLQGLVLEYLKLNPCIDCGETNAIVLEFDHRDGEDKYFEISQGIRKGLSWDKIKNEMDKCDVRCANCHRIRTAKQFNWYKGFDLY